MQLYLLVIVLTITGNASASAGLASRTELSRPPVGWIEEPGAFPFQVRIQDVRYPEPWRYHFCAGTIYNANTIITSASCMLGTRPEILQIVAGDNNITVPEGFEQVIKVSEIISHPEYKIETLEHDIALLKLSDPLLFTNYVQPVALPPYQDFHATGECILSGWGSSSPNTDNLFDIIQNITIPILATDDCLDLLYTLGVTDPDIRFCAGYTKEGKNACIGDHGGALTCLYNGHYSYFAGILSFDIGCNEDGYPGVYTAVAQYMDWIQRNE